ncbi:site-specific integrase [Actinoplanes sp. TBRC 11911]|uniref:site-specific integrase n=1 Tax=Actinoplanes sp. TBRC 11911 TaxID=2729386 RepID=UPI00145E51D0|nr:site-specific integrase [Actinoplanes sp. TBRC 11911]NMO53425.1 site-specific integrase [Actinoplanes sp. TBRC 11911]
MRPNPHRGRVYRRCSCRDDGGKQLGTHCPQLTSGGHGTWAFAVDLPSADGRRKTRRRSGFATKAEAADALAKVLECEHAGIQLDDTETVAHYLSGWLEEKTRTLKPNTVRRHHNYLTNDLIPAFGNIRLERLTHADISRYIAQQQAAGRGPVTLRRCITTLSSALNYAVRTHRLPYNAARFARLPRPARLELVCWSNEEAGAFLRYCHDVDDLLADLFELMICTGMRKGEALGLKWTDIDFALQMLFVRRTLISVDNCHTEFSDPKTPYSRSWIALSRRAVDALRRQRDRQWRQRLATRRYEDTGLVFSRPDGQPLRPQYVLDHFRKLTAEAGVPTTRLHDLRHLAATIMINSGVPLGSVSKTLRHSTVATTVDIYGHLTPQVAQDAVDAAAAVLDDVAPPTAA